jgi:two-component system sensor histidine kinase AgrC
MFGILPMLIYTVLAIVTYCFLFKQALLGSVLMGVVQIILVSCVDYLAYILLLPTNELMLNNYSLRVIVGRFVGLCILLIMYIFVIRFKVYVNVQSFKQGKSLWWAAYFLFLLLFSVPNAMLALNREMLTSVIDIYNAVLLVAFFIYNIIYVRSILKTSAVTQELETQRLYSMTLEASLDDLRGFKHDFANIISSIAGYINAGDLVSAKKVSDELTKKYLKINTTDVVNVQLKDIPHLYVMILSKLHRAETMNVDFTVTVQGELVLNYCEPLDFILVIGNLLDNALEGAAESGEKLVKLDILTRHGRNHIAVQNSYTDEVDINAIFEFEYSTKKGHIGRGLTQISSVIEKYRKQGYAMELQTRCEDGTFEQHLTI